ncbi:hypothetical protein QQZ08_003193 [Neonectria magnoliae]|uniref:Uncharacterized protein n=1 Tax=Neonectria magnoliae TaxID=2732573 RepID=A0ABR1IBK0_9HYPO
MPLLDIAHQPPAGAPRASGPTGHRGAAAVLGQQVRAGRDRVARAARAAAPSLGCGWRSSSSIGIIAARDKGCAAQGGQLAGALRSPAGVGACRAGADADGHGGAGGAGASDGVGAEPAGGTAAGAGSEEE